MTADWRPLHDHETRALQMPDEALREDLSHELVGPVDRACGPAPCRKPTPPSGGFWLSGAWNLRSRTRCKGSPARTLATKSGWPPACRRAAKAVRATPDFATFAEGSVFGVLAGHCRTARFRCWLVRPRRRRAKILAAGPVSSTSTSAGGAIPLKAEDLAGSIMTAYRQRALASAAELAQGPRHPRT
jgi:hypothetical protein